MKKLAFLLMVVFVISVGMISASNVFGETVKFGALWELTGGGASWGIPSKKVVEFQAMELNKKGGINVGGKRYLVEFVTEDGKCTSADALTAVKKLIFLDKVKFIVGPVCSASCAAIAPIIEENKVLMMTVVCGTDKWLSKETKYCFRSYPTSYPLIPSFLEWVAKNRSDIKNVAFFNANDESGKQSVVWGLPRIDKINAKNPGRLKHVGTEYYERGTEDFRPILMKLLRNNPDIMIGSIVPADASVVIKQSREIGYKGTFYGVGPLNTPYLVNIAGKENCEGVLQYGMDWEATPQLKEFYNNFKSYYGEEPLAIGGWGIDGFPLMVRGIEEARSFDVDKVVKVIESWKTFKTYYGEAYWGGLETCGVKHQICRPWPITVIRNGKEVVLATPMADIP